MGQTSPQKQVVAPSASGVTSDRKRALRPARTHVPAAAETAVSCAPMKLHLGCGQRYLEGYRNIDFPASEHTIQQQSVADERADLTTLRFATGSVAEVRLHHVFEHFPRPQAVGLLVCWHAWLQEGGVLRIEVPDFARQALAILNPLASAQTRRLGIRHLFGSHEARWAVHCEGWTGESLRELLTTVGFAVEQVVPNHWRGTHNVEVSARKRGGARSRAVQRDAARRFLSGFLVDGTDGERLLLEVWLRELDAQLGRGVSPSEAASGDGDVAH
jgi:hypothetical protein